VSVVGIDLGTTNTVVACVRSGKVHVLADEQGNRLLPSVVSFHPNGEVLVGGAARARRVIDPRNTVYSHKRLIGRSWGSPEIAQAKQRFAFELREGPGQGPLVHARNQDYTLPEISAFVLKRVRQIAETALGTPVERAVITVPAHFNELQRASTKVAGRVSGLEVLRILNEPTAAALAYGLGRTGNERVAVYDFGGGTFDCTLLDLNGNVFEVLATAGDSFLGGDDVDNMIADRMAEAYLKAHRQDPKEDPSQWERLKTSAEEMKVALSTNETHTMILKDFGFATGGSSVHFTFTMTRKDLEAAITPLVDRSFKVTQDALSLARLTPTSFDKVILVGGSTRIPLVRKRVEAFFGAPPMDRVNPDEVVAIGAAIQAAALTEGQRKRSIPAPPGVPGAPRTRPGMQSEVGETTHTSELDATKLRPGAGPASGGPLTKDGPPPSVGVSGARPPPEALKGGRKVTNPGVAPATQPLGARQPGAPAPPPGHDDDPSIASFPDLAVPTPFEWFPSGSPGSGAAQSKGAGSERSFGANNPVTKASAAVDPQTLTATAPAPGAGVGPKKGPIPAAGKPAAPQGFGAIDEPPSLVSSIDQSIPSFASVTSQSTNLPSPVGEPEPMEPDLPGGGFGEVRDLSLISTSARAPVTAPMKGFGEVRDQSIIATPEMQPRAGKLPAASSDFGHVSDLSLISPGTGEGMDAVTQARKQALEQGSFDDDDTAAMMRGKDPAADADLPAVVHTADLPATKSKPMPARKPQSSMVGKAPPPLIAPQPFGPMEKIDEAPPASQHTSAMPHRPPPVPTPSKPPPLRQPPPAPPPMTQRQPSAPPPLPPQQPSYPPTQAQPQAYQQPPPAVQPFAQFGQPPPQQPFGQTAPMAQQSPFGGPPPGYVPSGSQPPQPIFGAFSSDPPNAMSDPPMPGPGGFDPGIPMAPTAPHGLGYAAPVLVDVTPRALVVETAGGYTDTVIPRNAKIPCERTRRFATGRDMQTSVRVRVGQGEHPAFGQNTFLGEVELSGLRPAPRGEVVVAVTFECDADGTLRVRARDVHSGHEARATLQLVGVADESSVVMMINRFAHQPVTGGDPGQQQ
jgi:molecular chaperone DnaK